MHTTIISSQRYLDPAIVAEKQDSRDFGVTLSPPFNLDGDSYQVILDGHHSLAAALASGVEPEFIIADETDVDSLSLLREGEIEDFLEVNWMDSDYYDIATGRTIW